MRHFESFIDQKGCYVAGKSTEILLQKNGLDLKVALGILNSKLVRFYIKQAYSVLGIDGGINFTTDLIESLPVPRFQKTGVDWIIKTVDKILMISQSEDYLANISKQSKVAELKREMDQMVYKLYSLTDNEIAIVEGS